MSNLLTSPTFVLHRTIALNPLVPDAADPAITDPDIREGSGFTHASIYWAVSGGAAASDDDTITVRIIGFDEFQQVWTRIRTVVLRVQERVIVPLLGQRIFVRVDAEATTATQAQLFVAGYTGAVEQESDYVTLPEQPTTFAPGGATGAPDTGWVFTRDVAGTTELFYEDSAGNVTQLTGAGAASGLQAAYDIDPSIVTTAVVGPLGGPVSIEKGAGTAVGDSAFTVSDLNVVINRTAPLVLIVDNNDGGVANFASVEIRKNNSTNSGVNLLLSGADLGSLGPILRFFHDSGSPATNDVVGRLSFDGRDAGAAVQRFVRLDGVLADPNAIASEGRFDIFIRRSNVESRVLTIAATNGAAEGGALLTNLVTAGANPAFTFSAIGAFGAGQTVFRVLVNATAQTPFALDGDGDLTLTSIAAGATGVELQLYQNSATPAANDIVGLITFFGEDGGGAKQQYTQIDGRIGLVTAGSEIGVITLSAVNAGTMARLVAIYADQGVAAVERGVVFENFLAAGAAARQFEFQLSENSATVGPRLSIFRNRTNDAVDGDAIGCIDFDGMDDGTPSRDTYARIAAIITDSGSGSEDGALDWSFVNAGTIVRAARFSGLTNALDTGLLQESFLAAGATNLHHELKLTDATATVGPYFSLFRDSSSPANNDLIGGLAFHGNTTGPVKQMMARMYVRMDDVTAFGSTTASTIIFDTVTAGAPNEAVRFDGGGQIHADLGAGTGNVTVFDDYDDAMVIREMYPMGERKQEALDRLVEMGVCSRKNTGSGYMVNFQKMFALLAGGIYQTRERFDVKVEELANENAMLKSRIIALEAMIG